MEEIKRPSSEWNTIHAAIHGMRVSVPDGWDCANLEESWSVPITWEEFNRRAGVSTMVPGTPDEI